MDEWGGGEGVSTSGEVERCVGGRMGDTKDERCGAGRLR